ncbi:dnaJ homolog subfamily C member 17-like [Galendromus occidentalis]|uniref:DnaJ homolog subfamily C member 17-like n=1 Tax=Galendromus occidentalis TaxID=34638 RepID=A0AAJ7WGL6_9ACAR|nr:dnaJ homolog subfamily C member 17-like [Galendromus occidentalis]
MAADKKKIDALMKTDLYGLFDLTSEASEKEIKSAYRKKALKCHPDKNPDDPKAAELFHNLTDALGVLTDAVTRGVYDKLLKAKESAAIRHRELDIKRRKLIDDLEARERRAAEERQVVNRERQLQQEIERLRKEGSRIVEEESRLLRERLARTISQVRQENHQETSQASNSIKIRWKRQLGTYKREDLERILGKYGRIMALVVSDKKPTAQVIFENIKAAEAAVEKESGLPENPLTLSWYKRSDQSVAERPGTSSVTSDRTGNYKPSFQFPSKASQPTVQDDLDFEQMVFAKMRAKAKEQREEAAIAQEREDSAAPEETT